MNDRLNDIWRTRMKWNHKHCGEGGTYMRLMESLKNWLHLQDSNTLFIVVGGCYLESRASFEPMICPVFKWKSNCKSGGWRLCFRNAQILHIALFQVSVCNAWRINACFGNQPNFWFYTWHNYVNSHYFFSQKLYVSNLSQQVYSSSFRYQNWRLS